MGASTAIAIGGLAVSAAGVGMNAMGQNAAGVAKSNAADFEAKMGTVKAQGDIIRALWLNKQADQVDRDSVTERQYIQYATEREALWADAVAQYDRDVAEASAARAQKDAYTKYTDLANYAVDKAVTKAEGARIIAMDKAQFQVQSAELLAQIEENKTKSSVAQTRMQSKYQTLMAAIEGDKTVAAARASAGARGVAMTGSALDVYENEMELAELKQKAIKLTGDFKLTDITIAGDAAARMKRYEGAASADSTLLAGYTTADQALGEGERENQYYMHQMETAIYDIDQDMRYKVLKQQIQTAHDVDLIKENGWRTGMKYLLDSTMKSDNLRMQATGLIDSAAAQNSASSLYNMTGASYGDSSGQIGSLLTGGSKILDTLKTFNWGTSTTSTSSDLLSQVSAITSTDLSTMFTNTVGSTGSGLDWTTLTAPTTFSWTGGV